MPLETRTRLIMERIMAIVLNGNSCVPNGRRFSSAASISWSRWSIMIKKTLMMIKTWENKNGQLAKLGRPIFVISPTRLCKRGNFPEFPSILSRFLHRGKFAKSFLFKLRFQEENEKEWEQNFRCLTHIFLHSLNGKMGMPRLNYDNIHQDHYDHDIKNPQNKYRWNETTWSTWRSPPL